MTFGLSTEDSLNYLKENKINICERTLRRDKEELKQQYGNNVKDIFFKEIASDLFKDFFSFQEIQNQCWNMIQDKKTTVNDKIRLFGCITKTMVEKLRFSGKIPQDMRAGKIIPTTDEGSPFEITVKKSISAPSTIIPAYLLREMYSDKTHEQNDQKADTVTQEHISKIPKSSKTNDLESIWAPVQNALAKRRPNSPFLMR